MRKRIVVMVRHGESEWSKNNIFCGWYNSYLSAEGIEEAKECAKLLENYEFDRAYTSQLARAHQTLEIIIQRLGQSNLSTTKSWKLNERHYGALTGNKKSAMVEEHGKNQVYAWRRSYDIVPPPMTEEHTYYQDILSNSDLRKELENSNAKFPKAESFKDTMERVIPYWKEFIVPSIERGERILIVAHGTVLRSLIKYLEDISDNDIRSVNVPSGIPFVYEFDDNMRVVSQKRFLGDQKRLEEGIARAASIGSH